MSQQVSASNAASLTAIYLESVWVPHPPGYVAKEERRGRGATEGPNGEPADSGKWRLRLPNIAGFEPTWGHLGKPGTIYDGPTLSPSAIETFSECEAKWAYSRLDSLEKPPNRPAEMGGERHTELEKWLKKGTPPATKGMLDVLQHFPMPGECESEPAVGFIFGRPGHEIIFAGFMDVRQPGVIYDLKTTGKFDWKKTPAQLEVNLQAAVYGLAEMLRQCSNTVVLKWVYGQIKTDGTIIRVETVCERDGNGSTAETNAYGVSLTRAKAVATLSRYLPLAERMREIILTAETGGIRAKDLPKNGDSCSMYGGCPWRKSIFGPQENEPACIMPSGGGFLSQLKQHRAQLGKGEQMTAGGGMASRFAKKNGEAAAAAAVATVATVATTPSSGGLGARFAKAAKVATAAGASAPTSAPEPSKVDVKATKDGISAGATATSPASAPASGTLLSRLKGIVGNGAKAAAVESAVESAPVRGVLAVGINPPDAAPEWTQEQQAAEAERIAGGKKAPKVAAAVVTAATTEVAATEVVAEAEAPKRGRGRPPGSKNKTTDEVSENTAPGSVNIKVDAATAATFVPGATTTATAATFALPPPVTTHVPTQQLIDDLDGLALRMMTAGHRRAARLLLEAVEHVA